MTRAVDRVRHGRQIRLAEIGEAGQERLAATEVVLGGVGHARDVEAAYAARAGMRVIEVPEVPLDASAEARGQALAALGIRDAHALEVADGAMRALLAIRAALGIDGGASHLG